MTYAAACAERLGGDTPSDPELVIELGEISDVGLEAYEYEEK